jgi:hypothetical protein
MCLLPCVKCAVHFHMVEGLHVDEIEGLDAPAMENKGWLVSLVSTKKGKKEKRRVVSSYAELLNKSTLMSKGVESRNIRINTEHMRCPKRTWHCLHSLQGRQEVEGWSQKKPQTRQERKQHQLGEPAPHERAER